MTIKLKRAYANISDEDGIRILVDRLWPRGLSKEKLKLRFVAKRYRAFYRTKKMV